METDDQMAQRILRELPQTRVSDPALWVTCNIVVIEDIETAPWGVNAEFLTVPRVGEFVGGFGRVDSVSHGPMLPDGASLPYPYVTVFVSREGKNADRT